MDSFQSSSAQAIKSYLQEVHGVLLYSIQQVLSAYQANLLQYKNGFYDIDSDIYSTIPEEVLINICNKLGNEVTSLNEIATSIQDSLTSVSDIVSIGNPSKNNLHTTLSGIKGELLFYRNSIDAYEIKQNNIYKNELQDVIDSLQIVINDYLHNSSGITSYRQGAICENPKMLDLYQKVQSCTDRMQTNQEAIEAAAARQKAVYEQMQADYEAACEARKDKGTANIIMGGIAVITGGAAIILTAGMATPIVVTAGVAGTCTMAYGISNAAEGAQDVYYGSIGDLESASINPIRDTIFVGNQGLYDAWGSLNMTVAGLCVPVGQAVNGMAGASTTLLAKTTIKVVGKEMAKDAVYDCVSDGITNYATDKLSLNQTV